LLLFFCHSRIGEVMFSALASSVVDR